MIQIRPDGDYWQTVIKAKNGAEIQYSKLFSKISLAQKNAQSLIKTLGLKGKAAKINYA